MSCFWDNILISLNDEDYNYIGLSKMNNYNFIRFLKNMNEEVNEVLWNDIKLTDKQIEENLIHIDDYPVKEIENGYLCSICDPFLLLICHLFRVNIEHIFLDTKQMYTIRDARRTIQFKSNESHFSVK
tara:strand:+ start:115 stop:498 length:384 start_codon:yes stop_codon:yes gene_type:complete